MQDFLKKLILKEMELSHIHSLKEVITLDEHRAINEHIRLANRFWKDNLSGKKEVICSMGENTFLRVLKPYRTSSKRKSPPFSLQLIKQEIIKL